MAGTLWAKENALSSFQKSSKRLLAFSQTSDGFLSKNTINCFKLMQSHGLKQELQGLGSRCSLWNEVNLIWQTQYSLPKGIHIYKNVCQKLTESHQCPQPVFSDVVQKGPKPSHDGWMKCEKQEVEECKWCH